MRVQIISAGLLAVMLGSARPAGASEVGYYAQPAMHGQKLVFVSEGDLWSAALSDDLSATILAHRLTSDVGQEGRPAFSPDGTMLAFTAQYDGNVDVYTMPFDGGAPTRLTFHPGDDICLGFTADSREVLFKSSRINPLSVTELWKVSINGGMPERFEFGECSLASINPGGKVIAFTRWSNENWSWKGYRGGTAPEIWIGELGAGRFWKLTDDPANDLFPMWLRGRVYFLSDRTGLPNFFSDSIRGGELQQHTVFAADPKNPTTIEGYDIRWPSADPSPRASRIVFSRAGELAVFDAASDTVTRLDVRLASDRVQQRRRFTDSSAAMTEFALSPDGSRLIVGSRGELLEFDTKDDTARAITSSSATREWGASFLDDERLVYITDASGEQQLAKRNISGSDLTEYPLTTDREDWLFPPVVSPDGTKVAFADKTLRLHVLDLKTGARDIVDRSDAAEVTQYRFSPDSMWLAYTKPMLNQFTRVFIYSLRTKRTFPVTNGLFKEHHPAWDPKGQYLYLLVESELNPLLGNLDFDFVVKNTTRLAAVSLRSDAPAPTLTSARQVNFDLEGWADPENLETVNRADVVDEAGGPGTMRVDTTGLANRLHLLAVEAGTYTQLEAVHGGVCFVSMPLTGLNDEVWPPPPPGAGEGTLMRFTCVNEETVEVAQGTNVFTISRDLSTLAYPSETGLHVVSLANAEEAAAIDVATLPVRIDMREEWKHILAEAWRLQRDFYWASNMAGIDWNAMKVKYEALLPRIGSRAELNDLIGEMIGELRTSHTYVWGGDEPLEPRSVNVGLLGADVVSEGGGYRIVRIIPSVLWNPDQTSPLANASLGVTVGDVITHINGHSCAPGTNLYDLLQGQADQSITISVRRGNEAPRDLRITPPADDTALRYAAWVEANRAYVDDKSGGRIGYMHLPDMDAEGLVAFIRYFYPQLDRKGMIIDIRRNGGGFVSQMVIQRLARKIWAFQQPRTGMAFSYPEKTLNGHLVTIIDQHAGSDGDIFPESFRLNQLGPLIGTRTWGGVVGIRMDKPFVDMGVSSQPEFAWWEPTRGWTLENTGVSPDIEMVISPSDRARGADTQLDKALEVVLKRLEEQPMELPNKPDYPNKSGR